MLKEILSDPFPVVKTRNKVDYQPRGPPIERLSEEESILRKGELFDGQGN